MKKLKIKLKFKEIICLLIIWFLIYKFIKRSDLIGVIQRALPSGEAGLLAGMVWGEKGLISRDLDDLLKNTGLVHIVVVSGANLMIIGRGIIESLAKLIGRKMAIIGGGGIVLLYVNLVGWQIPVVRAVLFLAIYYWAQMLGRQFKASRALFLVILVMFLADFKIFTEISFWLSVTAFLGVLLSQEEGVIKSTIWVSLFILPILSIFFGTVSVLTPIINLGVLFLVEIITIIGFLGSIIGLLWDGLGKIGLSVSYPMLRYLIEIVEVVGKWEWGVVNFQFNWWILSGWYLLIGGYWYEKKKR
ncbi:MAG TPA: ComEC/Rec2 family competence protein [Candidatus Woesebacteria bacterium]|nr:ComEC/Rec2 family competence protein [Candidatus Woesebacteria bacterium]